MPAIVEASEPFYTDFEDDSSEPDYETSLKSSNESVSAPVAHVFF